MRFGLILMASVSVLLIGCGNDIAGGSSPAGPGGSPSQSIASNTDDGSNPGKNATKPGDLSSINKAYRRIKEALAADDRGKAAEGAKALLAEFDDFKPGELSDSGRKEYSEIVENAREQAEHIEKSEVPHQKEHLEVLTEDIADLNKLLGAE